MPPENLAQEGGSRGDLSVIILRSGSKTLLVIITEDFSSEGGSRGIISVIISRCGSKTLLIIITEDLAP